MRTTLDQVGPAARLRARAEDGEIAGEAELTADSARSLSFSLQLRLADEASLCISGSTAHGVAGLAHHACGHGPRGVLSRDRRGRLRLKGFLTCMNVAESVVLPNIVIALAEVAHSRT